MIYAVDMHSFDDLCMFRIVCETFWFDVNRLILTKIAYALTTFTYIFNPLDLTNYSNAFNLKITLFFT